MKKGIGFLVLILLVAIVIENAPAEGILAFENLEYDTIPKKSITLVLSHKVLMKNSYMNGSVLILMWPK